VRWIILLLVSVLIPNSAWSQGRYLFIFDYYHSAINTTSKFNQDNSVFNFENSCEVTKFNHQLNYKDVALNWNVLAQSQAFQDGRFEFVLREIYWQTSLNKRLDLTIGKQLFRWGTGFYKNPAAFADAPKRTDDLSDRLQNQQGRESVSLSLFWGDSDFHILYLPDYAMNEGKLIFHNHEIIFKYYLLLGSMDITALYDYSANDKNRFGLTFAYAVNDYLALQAEWMIQKGSARALHLNTEREQPFQAYQSSPYTLKPFNNYLMKFLAGFNYTAPYGLNIIMEYIYDGEALSGAQWKNLMKYADWLTELRKQANFESLASDNLRWIALSLNQQKHYLFYRLSHPLFHRVSLEWIGVSNLSDDSAVLILASRFILSRTIELNLRSNFFVGDNRSDFGGLFRKWEVRGGFHLYF